ncbi:4-(cytidine 5'-diphospho)-2-C-methyl-D-erythritol kinase [Pseudohoeflea suaedae]|uniref:4-diphosphocytidyl-2-C-methyl-D-erythritol kinase n=1 Tax=Pseudohoeflea suaedae TaxID=877384 RepID=A0A4R5PNK2_9HYPH|nr:4-(cytidine 5'-diphospho)-2-C-methyl-D-erythritol kinase [Pseudohoeflea suaedae]TDH38632.1 4-(cytidine 5'-diphospho)-2-C-methyl-D-erythritol kinase [Pseudohoeflea suaedae]
MAETEASPAEMTGEAAPAKINLALAVTGKRADGYHLLETLVVFARHGDRIEVAESSEDSLVIDGPHADALKDGDLSDNLVTRARDRLRSHLRQSGKSAPPVALRLEKNLPVASGIGGGSADAAATLRLLIRFWNAAVSEQDLRVLALSLGADVPMCLESAPLMARGIGEDIEPVEDMACLPMVLANPGVAVSTPSVFKALVSPDNPPLPPLPATRGIAGMAGWMKTARNDLAEPALSLSPQIGTCLAAIRSSGALVHAMSGSGATCFGIYESMETARQAARQIGREWPRWFVAATETR